MKTLLSICSAICLLFSTALAGKLAIIPQKPTVEDALELTYEPDGRFDRKEKLFAYLYVFRADKTMPKAFEIRLKRDGYEENYKASFKVPRSSVFALLKIGDDEAEIFDNDFFEYYAITFYGDDGKPVRGANLKDAFTRYGVSPENFERNPDFDLALRKLKNELANYPDNVEAKIGLLSLSLDLGIIDYETYKNKISRLKIDENKNYNQNQIRAIARALRSINQAEKAARLEDLFIAKRPRCELAEERELIRLSQAKTLKDFSKIAVDFLKRFPRSSNRDKTFLALVDAYLQTKKIGALEEILSEFDDAPGEAFSKIAFSLTRNEEIEKDLKEKERFRKIVALMEKAIASFDKLDARKKPRYLTKREWRKNARLRLANVFEQYGDILSYYDLFEEALDKYAEALDLYKENAPLSLFLNSASALENLERFEDEAKLIKLALKDGKYNEDLIKKFKRALKKLGETDIESYVAKETAKAERKALKRLRYVLRKKKTSDVFFQDENGLQINVAKADGKVEVLAFFSSWQLSPDFTLAAVDSLEKTVARFKDVSVYPIDVWEKTKNYKAAADSILATASLNIEVFYDPKGLSARKLGVSGLPTFCFIDRNGNLRFIIKGLKNIDEFVRESLRRIKFLLEIE